MRMRSGRVLPVLVAAAAVMATGATNASATFSSGSYSHDDPNDPRDSTTPGRPNLDCLLRATGTIVPTRTTIQSVMGWVPSTGTDQAATSSGHCTAMEYAAASAECGTCNRTHIRLNQTHELDAQGHYETVGTPHYDRSNPNCGGHHDVPAGGYTGARADILNAMTAAGHHFSRWEWWGNTQSMQQCDGSYASSDGWVGWEEEL